MPTPSVLFSSPVASRWLGVLLVALAAATLCGSPAPAQENADTPAATAEPAAEPAAEPEAADTPPAEAAAETDADTPAVDPAPETPAEEPVDTPVIEPAAAPPSEVAAGADVAEADPAEGEPMAGVPSPENRDLAAGDAAEAAIDEADAGGGSALTWLVTLAAIVVPILLGNWLAKAWRMPEKAWRIATVLTSLSVAALCVATGQFKGGPDLAGGITLVYELADPDLVFDPLDPDQPPADEADDAEGPRRRVDMEQLIAALKRRIDPAGTKEVSIRNYGGAIEIIIPKAGPDDLQFIKRRITDLGQLEFRIVADRRWSEDRNIIEAAANLGPSEKIVSIGGATRAKWVPYDTEKFPVEDPRLVTREANGRDEILVLMDRWDVTGEYLTGVSKSYGDLGRPVVNFNFDSIGSAKFGRFTGENLPNPATPDVKRKLGILLDDTLLSAPELNDRITGSGQITIGGPNVEQEVDNLVGILNAGSLPAALVKTPISEEQVSPTLGAETIQRGTFAIGVSLAAVLLFILVYYRFAGLVACLALAATLLLVLAAMVVMQAAFTLPGLAGLVLTVGMAVDANVLIFERIREELAKGAGLRMAIRNGFGKATTTIIDANVTTLIAAVILYNVGTGPIKGFGITLFLGIVMSMYTAIFCARTVFDIAERRRWIKTLKFGSILGETNIDFIGKRVPAIVFSVLLIAAGLVGVFGRGENLLDIDFTGGSSVTFVLDEPMTFSEVNEKVRSTELGDKNLTVIQSGETGLRFTVNSGIDDVERVEAVIAEEFGDSLKNYALAIGEPEAFEERGGTTGTTLPLTFNEGEGFGENDGLTHDALVERIEEILAQSGRPGVEPQLENPAYTAGSSQRFKEWTMRLGLPAEQTVEVAEALQAELAAEPLFPLASKIGARVAGDLQEKAVWAVVLSLIGIIAYLWFRFQNVYYGVAAVIALIHDVLVTLGAIALSAWVVSAVPPLATALQIDAFQISLPILAAFITIIGYSLNDTIVIFDRIREVRGKSPRLTAETVNKSINQTLSRTVLTSLTTLIVVVVLYFFGGAGIHAFAFALVVGVIVGTYSTVFIATPALLALAGTDDDGTAATAGNPRAAA
ncbi:protein translocase subunit SecD [Botrimarina sp.]|uniref:protein translocase subunit SecD n=1 Tax=Botrimarina sp. TaxID=2795802 RepID=UPI0032ED47CB